MYLLQKTTSTFVAFFLLIAGTTQGQVNLVPNPSFETFSTCPTGSGQITNAISWYGPPSGSTTDYYNSCSPTVGVPAHGAIGYQQAHSGNAYAGIWTFNGPPDYREYLQVMLDSALTAGDCYYVEYYVNLFNELQFATNGVSCHFSTSQVLTTGTGSVLNLTSSFVAFADPVYTDTLNWMKVCGVFTASGGEQWLTIGNFANDANTDTLSTNFGSYYGAYYYVDDVSVTRLSAGSAQWSYQDTSLIFGDSVFIGNSIGGLNCTWYDSSGNLLATNTSGIFVQPQSTTSYIVQQNVCGTIYTDTLNVSITPSSVEEHAGNDFSLKIIPQPSDGNFIIQFVDKRETTELKIEICDLSGKCCYKAVIKPEGKNFYVAVPHLSSGLYFVKTFDTFGANGISRLAIEK
ncbi:MAG: T9SS type A sorting domain-containing protein [Bacteroidia bacterium]|nr:T9SS type A sorting domain-containing protein [Bacteroidia bacterium]